MKKNDKNTSDKGTSPAKRAKKLGASSLANACRFVDLPDSTLGTWFKTKPFVFDAVIESVAAHEKGVKGYAYKHHVN